MALPRLPAGANIAVSGGGRFFPTPGPSTGPLGGPGRVFAGSNFVPRSGRLFGITAEIDMGQLMTLGVRMEVALRVSLAIRLGEAADFIVQRAKGKLVKGHGLDTSKMRDSLRKVLVDAGEKWIVAYDLGADPAQADYWVFVEFGHMTRGGNWWPGYHFLSSTLMENEVTIRAKVAQAMVDATMAMAAQGLLASRFF